MRLKEQYDTFPKLMLNKMDRKAFSTLFQRTQKTIEKNDLEKDGATEESGEDSGSWSDNELRSPTKDEETELRILTKDDERELRIPTKEEIMLGSITKEKERELIRPPKEEGREIRTPTKESMRIFAKEEDRKLRNPSKVEGRQQGYPSIKENGELMAPLEPYSAEETFAGKRILGLDSSTIRSSRGSIRGVKNRVRAGIDTFLHIKSTKTWQEKEMGQVVVYTTTMGVIRETYQRCLKVRHILRTHLIKYVEKDVFMSREVQNEIKERMGSSAVELPQVFVEGVHLGDADIIEKLNETGDLRTILKPYKNPDVCTTCTVCGGYQLLPCGVCNGSKKSVHRNHFNSELVALKCMNCDEVGLVRCYAC